MPPGRQLAFACTLRLRRVSIAVVCRNPLTLKLRACVRVWLGDCLRVCTHECVRTCERARVYVGLRLEGYVSVDYFSRNAFKGLLSGIVQTPRINMFLNCKKTSLDVRSR